jgi:DNA-binding NtrC family response regulator
VCEFDLVVSDFMMPEMSGGEFLQALKDVAPTTVRIMLSASTDFRTAMTAINDAHVFRFKPWQQAELEQNILQGLEERRRLLAEAAPAPTAQELEAAGWRKSRACCTSSATTTAPSSCDLLRRCHLRRYRRGQPLIMARMAWICGPLLVAYSAPV